jgi:two-component system chemotaxis response regulator CheB
MISTLTSKGAPATLDALAIGAVDYIAKPQGGSWDNLSDYAQTIQSKVRNAAIANMAAHDRVLSPKASVSSSTERKFDGRKVICIGSSTGGTEALREVLQGMPVNCPPILMAQHIPASFSASLAQRLNSNCDITVKEAKSGMPLEAGHAYLAPGDFHLKVYEKNGKLVTSLYDGDKVSGHKPSVDVLFDSVLEHFGKKTVAAILTGMGSDGAQGMKNIMSQGGVTFAQDEATSVVWGMPGAAVKLDAVQKVLPINKIRDALLKACEK